MPEFVFYLRTPSQLPFEVPISDGLVKDAKLLADVSSEQAEAIGRELQAYDGFLERRSLEAVIRRHLPEDDVARRLARFIELTDKRFRESNQNIPRFLQAIETWLDDEDNHKKELISREDIGKLSSRLALLIESIPGLDRQAKARRLGEVIGQSLERMEMVCDLRPVFDESRERIEGLIPVTTLKVVATGVDGLPISLEVVLSEKDVNGLVKVASKAQTKLKTLQEFGANTGLPIPTTELTQQAESDDDNE